MGLSLSRAFGSNGNNMQEAIVREKDRGEREKRRRRRERGEG